jgi:cobalt-zinc-cadmium efflux system membrane fusion protein
MQNDADEKGGFRPLSAKYQFLTVAGFAAVAGPALALLLLAPGNGQSASEKVSKPTYFVPSSDQVASMRVMTVELRSFHTETLTEGFVAANGRWSIAGAPAGRQAPGMPVLAAQSSDLVQAENDLATAAAQLRVAKAAEQRQHKLYQLDGAALKDWQQSQTDLATATASFETARNKLRLLGKSDRDIGSIASLAQNAADSGPASGRVFIVGDSSLVWLVANVREADAGHVHLGDVAEVRIPALAEKVLRVRISYLSSAIDPVTHRLVAGGIWRNDDGALKPNMLARFDITERGGATAPAVPESAVIYEGDQARIWIVDANGRYFLRNISVGRSREGYVEVLRGVSAGEKVVVSGALFVDQEKTGN